jgi:hypothetical protein
MPDEKQYWIFCDECGEGFWARSANTKLCAECKVKRKKKQDANAWRKRKMIASYRKGRMRWLEPQHMEELGISSAEEYARWKRANALRYRDWTLQHLPDDFLTKAEQTRKKWLLSSGNAQ